MSINGNMTFVGFQKKRNRFNDNVEEFSLSGDLAGILVSRLNKAQFDLINSSNNTKLKDTLSVDEDIDVNELQEDSQNTVVRRSNTFFIWGNYTDNEVKNNPMSSMNIKLLSTWFENELYEFGMSNIGENINRQLKNKVNRFMESLISKVNRYFKDISYEVEYKNDDREIEIIIWKNYETIINKININVFSG